ncbi:hypothetical protein ACTMTF_15265 [Nonomuraea sp. ZG12]|uniref:hypothetical protein n=1 Tax=Nonomuraea sp. ZG12 TaxID=3452207 RepID=UPI003F8CAAEB
MNQFILKCEIPGRGLFQMHTYTMDLMIARYLPDNVAGLCQTIDDIWRLGMGQTVEVPAREEIHTVTEALFVIAELTGYGV